MNDNEKRRGECSCHISPPCEWCISLTGDEVDAYWNGGMAALRHYWSELDNKEPTPETSNVNP